MEAWRAVWRKGFAPQLSTCQLEALKRGLLTDDPALVQGATTCPPPLQAVLDWKPEGACAITYGPWQGDGIETVGELEECFARLCFEADQRIGEPAACRFFLNAFDDWPRDVARRELLAEVQRELAERSIVPELAAT